MKKSKCWKFLLNKKCERHIIIIEHNNYECLQGNMNSEEYKNEHIKGWVKVNPKYKDRLFCLLFGNKENILSLYNALKSEQRQKQKTTGTVQNTV